MKRLSALEKCKFKHAKKIFDEVINYWEIEIKNMARRKKILNSKDLDRLNLEIGKSVGLQFLYLLCPKLDKKSRDSIASVYGFAVKLSDNFSDLDRDLSQGYINISKDAINKYNLDINKLNNLNILE